MKSYHRYKGRGSRSAGKRLLKVLIALFLAAVLIFGVLLGFVLAGSHDEVIGEPKIMIILGCQVMPSGAPSVLLRDRLDKALLYLEEHPDMCVVVTGGMGGNEPVSEAKAMADYLVSNGISESMILLEERASNTYENLLFSIELLSEIGHDVNDGVILVSNGFHLTRAAMLWNRVWGEGGELSVLAAPCSHFESMIWMHVREPLALAKDFLVRR